MAVEVAGMRTCDVVIADAASPGTGSGTRMVSAGFGAGECT